MVLRNKDPLAVGAFGIAFNAARYVKAGRKLGCRANGCEAIGVHDRRLGSGSSASIVRRTVGTGDSRSDTWREWLTEDERARRADEAASRMDFAA